MDAATSALTSTGAGAEAPLAGSLNDFKLSSGPIVMVLLGATREDLLPAVRPKPGRNRSRRILHTAHLLAHERGEQRAVLREVAKVMVDDEVDVEQ